MSDRWTRATRIALWLNALAASTATVAMALGLLPPASEQRVMARRAAAGEFGGVLVMVLVALRLTRDPTLIVLPMAFVACQVVCSVYDLAVGVGQWAPLVVEGLFLSIYIAYFTRARR
jgi:hypothetical protein